MIKISDEEIKQYLAEARVRRTSKYPRCDCQGNKLLETKWKKDAQASPCKFIENQYGESISKMDSVDRRAVKRDCAKFLPKRNMDMLERRGRMPLEFWDTFCGEDTDVEVLNDAQALKLLRRLYPKFHNAKSISDIKLTKRQYSKLIESVFISEKLSRATRKILKDNTGGYVLKKKPDTTMSLKEAELVLMSMFNKKTPDSLKFDDNGRLYFVRNSRQMWQYLAKKYGTVLPQVFLDSYASALVRKARPGRPASLMPKVKRVKFKGNTSNRVSKKKKVKTETTELLEKAKQQNTEEINNPPIVPSKVITTQEALRTFINTTMKKHDMTYPLSTEITRWSNPEWSMVDAYRDSIAPVLLQPYEAKIKQARSILGFKSGGAYASIRDNRTLAVAHIVTAWVCGDLV